MLAVGMFAFFSFVQLYRRNVLAFVYPSATAIQKCFNSPYPLTVAVPDLMESFSTNAKLLEDTFARDFRISLRTYKRLNLLFFHSALTCKLLFESRGTFDVFSFS